MSCGTARENDDGRPFGICDHETLAGDEVFDADAGAAGARVTAEQLGWRRAEIVIEKDHGKGQDAGEDQQGDHPGRALMNQLVVCLSASRQAAALSPLAQFVPL